MSAALKEQNLKAINASGQDVDLSDFEESFYKPGEVENALKDYFESIENVAEGQIVKGKILKITDKEIFVDVNFKSEGVIPIQEFKNINEFKIGDEIDEDISSGVVKAFFHVLPSILRPIIKGFDANPGIRV